MNYSLRKCTLVTVSEDCLILASQNILILENGMLWVKSHIILGSLRLFNVLVYLETGSCDPTVSASHVVELQALS